MPAQKANFSLCGHMAVPFTSGSEILVVPYITHAQDFSVAGLHRISTQLHCAGVCFSRGGGGSVAPHAHQTDRNAPLLTNKGQVST